MCGTPVAGYGRGGLREVVTPETGRLATANEPVALARAMTRPPSARPRSVRHHALAITGGSDGRRVRSPVRPRSSRRKPRDRLLRPPCRGRSPPSCPGRRRADLEHRHRALLAASARRTGQARGCSWPATTRSPHLARPDSRRTAPLGSRGRRGLRRRMAALSPWIDTAHPDVLVSDVSVEVTLLARLHGVPVVSVVLPGHRGTALTATPSRSAAAWSRRGRREATGMVRGLAPTERRRLRCVGGLSRLPLGGHRRPSGRSLGPGAVWSRRRAPHGSSAACGGRRRPGVDAGSTSGGPGEWRDDPAAALSDADVVVIQAGESAVADVAARRRPAVVVPATRPFDEQLATSMALSRGGWPCVVLPAFRERDWANLLEGWPAWTAAGGARGATATQRTGWPSTSSSFTTRRRRAGAG